MFTNIFCLYTVKMLIYSLISVFGAQIKSDNANNKSKQLTKSFFIYPPAEEEVNEENKENAPPDPISNLSASQAAIY